MKFLIVAIAFLACAYADVSELAGASSGYDYPQPALPAPAPVETYIPPAPPAPAPVETYIPPAAPAPAPAPIETYVPPSIPSLPAPAPAPAYIPPAPQPLPLAPAPEPVIEEIEQPAEDGYRYKTVRRRVFRHRA